MTKEEALNLSLYYISKAVDNSGAACVSVERKDGEWMVKDCSCRMEKEVVA